MRSKKSTSNGKDGGLVGGKLHSHGGTRAVVVDDNKRPVEIEKGEAILCREAVRRFHKELSSMNQAAGGKPIHAPAMKRGGNVELKKGVKEEQEHSGTIKKIRSGRISGKKAAEQIARDHLKKNKRYYSNLSKMDNMKKGGDVGEEQIQCVVLQKVHFTKHEAKKTISDLGFEPNEYSFHDGITTYRHEVCPRKKFVAKSLRKKSGEFGVTLIVGKLK